MGISLCNAALCLHGNSGNTACDYKRIPIEISKGGSIFYHITFVSVKGGNSAGVIVVYQKKRAGNS